MALITQLNTVNTGMNILNGATRAASQFNNSATSLLAELSAWEATLPGANLDAETLAEIQTIKNDTVAGIQAQLTQLQEALNNL